MVDFSKEEYAYKHLIYGQIEGFQIREPLYGLIEFWGKLYAKIVEILLLCPMLFSQDQVFKPKPGEVERPRQSGTVEAEKGVLQLVKEDPSASIPKSSSACS